MFSSLFLSQRKNGFLGGKETGFTMDYASMSLIELKKHAKGRRIKQYYVMKRQQLIQLLSMKELPEAMKIEKMTIHQLREKAKEKGIRGFWNLRREQLVDLLFPNPQQTTTNENEKNQSNTDKHDNPEQHDSQEIRVENLEDA